MRSIVSILVLMEVILQAAKQLKATTPYWQGFNPCFNGSHSSSHENMGCAGMYRMVSILVLMEVILQAITALSSSLPRACFNPCFNGSHSSSFQPELSVPCFP